MLTTGVGEPGTCLGTGGRRGPDMEAHTSVRDLPKERLGAARVEGATRRVFPWKPRLEVSRSVGADRGTRKGRPAGRGTTVDKGTDVRVCGAED